MGKIRLAIVIYGDLRELKGYFNASLNMAKALMGFDDLEVSVICLTAYDPPLTKMARKFLKMPPAPTQKPEVMEADGVKVKVLWYPFLLTDNLLYYKLHASMAITDRLIGRYVGIFKDFHILSCQSLIPGMLGRQVQKRFGIPYIATWHGTDIHTTPWKNPACMKLTKRVMHEAKCNIFVSKALKEKADAIDASARKEVIYNGVDRSLFYEYAPEERQRLRTLNGVSGVKVVSFIGGLRAVKNAQLLPDIFMNIKNEYNGLLSFWIVGDGSLRGEIESRMKEYSIDCRFWGDYPASKMPEIYNCTNVVVMPSQNEGLPLTPIEAIDCGANIVASNAGGIPEVIGEDGIVPLGDNFVSEFSSKVVSYLNSPHPQSLLQPFDWNDSAAKEHEIICSISSKYHD